MADYILLKAAERYLERMQPEDKVRIVNALDALITDSEMLDIKPLKGRRRVTVAGGEISGAVFRGHKERVIYCNSNLSAWGCLQIGAIA